MGDTGALLLGLMMAASTMVVGGRERPAGQRLGVLLLRTAVHPAAHPRRAHPRHRVVDRSPRLEAQGRGHRRQGPPPPPTGAPRSRLLAQRAHPVGVDRAAVGLRPVPDLHRRGQRHRARSASPRCLLLLYTVLHPATRRAGRPVARTRSHGRGRRRGADDRPRGGAERTRPTAAASVARAAPLEPPSASGSPANRRSSRGAAPTRPRRRRPASSAGPASSRRPAPARSPRA